ncbi:MAG: peptidoglycan-binding domain 1 [Beijerinckiaceae bacterium]|nr:MAG: peptidoglycan-binding domain 1 [Beijerinckiaceae bacterium]
MRLREAGSEMANALPWSVRGIDPDIREQAVEAAHRSGMSVGQWLNQVLAGNLDDDDMDDEPMGGRARRMPRRKLRRIDELNERLERLGQHRTSTAAHRFSDQDNDNAPVLDLLEHAVHAIERIEKRAGSASGDNAPATRRADTEAIAETLRAFERKLDTLAGPRVAQGAHADAGIEQRLNGILAMLDRMQAPPAAMPSAGFASTPNRGFPDEDPAFTRTLAEIEARRRNLDGDSTAPQHPATGSRQSTAQGAGSAIDTMRDQLGQLITRIDEMRAEPKADHTSLQSRLDELTTRIEAWRGQPQDDYVALRSDLAGLATSIEKLSPQRLVGMVETAVETMAEKAFRAQREGLPERLMEPLERVHEDVRAVLREVAASRGTDLLTQEVGNIARRLDVISQGADPSRLEDIARETAGIKTLVGQALRTQPLEGLALQIEALGKQIEKFQKSPGAGGDRQVLDAIRDVSDRLERIDPAATFKGIETRLATIGGIEDKLAEIARGMKKLAKEAQPFPQLDTITERLERIDRVLDNAKETPLAGLSTLAERLDKIGSSLDRVASHAPQDNQDALVGMLERLSERMDRVHATNADSTALDSLQDEIARLAKRMEQVGGAPAGLDGIERSVSDIFSQLDQNRRDMHEVAEIAATKAARETLKSAPAAADSNETLAAEGLLLIKRDLNEFKTAQSEAERRTRSTLEALHGTLETLVSRLGDVEAAPRIEAGSRPASAAAPMPPVKADAAIPAMTAQRPQPMPQVGRAEPASRTLKSTPGLDDNPADLPLEPGMQPGQAGTVMTADPVAGGDPRSNFIAAARRAAQNAADKSQQALAETKAPGKPGKPEKAPLDAGAAATSFIVRARKPILLGLAALVFSLGAMKVLTTRNIGGTDMVPPLQERPAQTKPLSAPVNPAGTSTPEPGGDPQSTGSAGTAPVVVENQPIPTIQPNGSVIPGITSPSLNAMTSGPGKRGQRLGETSAVSQIDPMTVGSINADGTARPIETGRPAIDSLIAQSGGMKGQDKLREAALDGNVAALFEIGARYADGRGIARDPKLAARWFEQAAASGHGPSQYRLASLYREGKGITKDPALAFQWFDRAAAQGHVLAMHNAAVLLAEGVHGAPDYAGAALWFKRAAEHGIKDSQFNVAILFARGLGVNQDLGEAYRWFAIAALQGDQDAGKKRDDIAARLPRDQLSRENERVKAFKPNKASPAANEPGAWEKGARQGT